MRYILNNDGYIDELSFDDNPIECKSQICIEYNGTTPTGYNSLNEWATGEEGKLNAWKVVDGNLVYDNAKYDELQRDYINQEKDNSYVCHKELYEMQQNIEDIQDVNDGQYKKNTASGKIINISNVKKVFPKVKLTNIQPYDYTNIRLITTGKNMLPNEATTQTINGVTFLQNTDRSISIFGISTAAIEYNIAGTSTNTSAFLVFKKDKTYYLSSNNKTIKMYYYDGTDRSEVYSGTGGTITFSDSDKKVTQIVLSIPTGTTINDTIYPQLEYGLIPSSYEMHKSRILNIDLTDYIETGLFPSETLYPSDTLFPAGSNIDYVLIESGTISALINNEETYINTGNVGLFDGVNVIYAIQDLNIEIDYCIDILNVDDLEFLQGKSTTTNNFKVLADGSIEAHNGYFSGDIYLSDGGKIVGENGLMNTYLFTAEDKMFGYMPDWDERGNTIFISNPLYLTFVIPAGLNITNATIQLVHTPIFWMNGNTVEAISHSRNIKLAKADDIYSRKIVAELFSEVSFDDSSTTFTEISGAFGTNGWTPSTPTTNNHPTETTTSIDIKDYLKNDDDTYQGLKTLQLYCPAPGSWTQIQGEQRIAYLSAILKIDGYMSY